MIDATLIAAIAALIALARRHPLQPGLDSRVDLTPALLFATALLLAPPQAALASIVGLAAGSLSARRGLSLPTYYL